MKSIRQRTDRPLLHGQRLGRRIVHTQSVESITEHEYYTHAWQRIEVRPGGETSTVGVSLFVYGIRYIDDIALRVRDANESGPPEERRYYLTDANYNVVMTVDDAGRGSERIFYKAYGEPECYSFGDVDGDYDVDNEDATELATIVSNGGQPYNVLADLNLDGAITQGDANLHSAYLNRSGGKNVLSVDDEANDIGYAGYLWSDERAQWHVRNRELSPKLGRWLQRDPFGFQVVSNELYIYGSSTPMSVTDPLGLTPVVPEKERGWDDGPCAPPAEAGSLRDCKRILNRLMQAYHRCKERLDKWIENQKGRRDKGHRKSYRECLEELDTYIKQFRNRNCGKFPNLQLPEELPRELPNIIEWEEYRKRRHLPTLIPLPKRIPIPIIIPIPVPAPGVPLPVPLPIRPGGGGIPGFEPPTRSPNEWFRNH